MTWSRKKNNQVKMEVWWNNHVPLNMFCTLPETNSKSTWKWMLGIRVTFPFGARPIFRGKLAVSFRECNHPKETVMNPRFQGCDLFIGMGGGFKYPYPSFICDRVDQLPWHFHIIGDGKLNPIIRVYIPIIRIPIKRWEVSHPLIQRVLTLAHILNCHFQCAFKVLTSTCPSWDWLLTPSKV